MEIIGVDPATAQLAVELQLKDVNTILDELRAEEDEYAAFDVMKLNLQDVLQLVKGQVLAMQILKADHENRVEFERLLRQEQQAVQDHGLARELDGSDPKQPSTPGRENQFEHQGSWLSDEDCLASYAPSITVKPNSHITIAPEEPQFTLSFDHEPIETYAILKKSAYGTSGPSSQQATKGKRKAEDVGDEIEHMTHTFCSACMDRHARFDVLELTCRRPNDLSNHAYCRSCLIDLFKTSLTDTTLFPPRCCGVHIPLSACVPLCPPDLIEQYEEKQIEMAASDPLYCSNRFCAKFMKREDQVADIATCPVCKTKTCAICKNPSHKGVCPEDTTVKLLMDVAGENKWQRCHKCRTMVELLVGCYHMRCRCGGEFCYLCAKPWKTCSCSQWDESRLLSNGQAVDVPDGQIAMPEEAEIPEPDPALDVLDDLHLRVATVAGGFAINNDGEELHDGDGSNVGGCVHKWKRVYGEGGRLEVCGICHQYLRFVNDCTMCKTKVCNRCLNNRL
ncbi:Nn.00g029210.m01.CDS01 [Neocucurbitaria sp. VM-36]